MTTDIFSKIFPFPRYLDIPAVGIDISGRSVKYVEFEKHGECLKIKRFGSKNIEKKMIEKGEVRSKEDLISCFNELNKELVNKYITVSLPEEKAFLRVVKLPLMDESQIKKSLEVQLEELIPFSPEDVIYDFEIIKNPSQKGVLEIALSAFPRKIIEDYTDVFTRTGMSPIIFELENHSLFRALVKSNTKEPTMIIDFGKTRTSFIIGEGGVVKFGSTINVAGENIERALAKNLNIDILEAEKVKKKTILQRIEGDNILDAIFPIISVIKDEVRQIKNYWQTHAEEQGFKNKEIGKIVLCGGDSNMVGLTDYLSYELETVVEVGNPWINITSFEKYVPEIERRESLKYATAIGLALRSLGNFKSL
ncbi:type IV pilus assembly protein PilM [Patescibacteria group bacterium]